MTSLYSDEHRAIQEKFGTTKLADLLDNNWVHDEIKDEERAFIESCDMFFLSTVDPEGSPTVSYKGGPVGFVKVIDSHTVIFPGFDGNGMFLSMGNIEGQGKVGLLFVDFVKPNRLRLQGTARMVTEHPLMAEYTEAKYLVIVEVTKAWINCPRYIHRFEKVSQSHYVPRPGRATPLASWKRLDIIQDALAPDDRNRAESEGLLDLPAYEAKVARGEG
jgi:predicted pyridoxine 5'-phosphate oxidase superfamily flavin-nucleotide-binding protein